jgi:hypothetical protein
MSTPLRGLRDAIASFVPVWLSNRVGKNNGYKFIYVVALVCDGIITSAVEGIYSWFPGYALGATNLSVDQASALPLIGRSRGIPRGIGESAESYAARLVPWLDDWKEAGSSEILLKMLFGYLGGATRIRIVDRSGNWVTLESDGTTSTTSAAWNWDGVSNPERAGFWSDMWIIVYPNQFGQRAGTLGGLTGDDGFGLGMMIPHDVRDTVRAILELWKGAHVFLRAVIFTTDVTLFDPANPSSLPDGQWGQWSNVQNGNGSRVASHRNTTTCRYMEPEVTL